MDGPMKSIKGLLVLLFLLAFISSCNSEKDQLVAPIDLLNNTYNNIPVKVNTSNSFTFTVNAKDLTYNLQDELIFDADSIVIILTLTMSNNSNSSVQIFDTENNIIFSELLNNDKVVVNTDIKGIIPKKIILNLTNFTGRLTIVVATDKS